jgi:hypothetical protein|nr:hypothetical protein Q903MT_gene3169 [Picea sitchensis]
MQNSQNPRGECSATISNLRLLREGGNFPVPLSDYARIDYARIDYARIIELYGVNTSW